MSTILVGSAPDSWGVWFPDDPNQTPYTRFLDEVADSGYQWIELGPYGYLPTGEVLEDRNLTADQWKKKTGGMNDLGKAMFEKYGVRAQYHPHADSHVD